MKLNPKQSIAEHFGQISDPRIERRKRHQLIDIITIGICAVVCGAGTWVEIEIYGKAKEQWLRKFLKLPNGIPSHDTFARVFAAINPEEFQKCFLKWVKGIAKVTDREIVAIDGKQSRNSGDEKNGKSAINMVSAWANSNRVVLGQRKVEGKSNEITAIPELIKVLELAGCIVTIDAIGCQKEIVKTIVAKEADYVIALKENQGSLYKQVKQLFKEAIASGAARRRQESSNLEVAEKEGYQVSSYSTRESNRGREEVRNYLMISGIAERIDPQGKWQKLNSIGMVESVRIAGGKIGVETRYFIGSLENNAQLLAGAIRGHWGIENSLHWILDVAMREDKSRIRKDNAPANFAILRHIAINLIGQNKSRKIGVKSKQFLALMKNI
jgi:predicted transposase YbfD/YdcC